MFKNPMAIFSKFKMGGYLILKAKFCLYVGVFVFEYSLFRQYLRKKNSFSLFITGPYRMFYLKKTEVKNII